MLYNSNTSWCSNVNSNFVCYHLCILLLTPSPFANHAPFQILLNEFLFWKYWFTMWYIFKTNETCITIMPVQRPLSLEYLPSICFVSENHPWLNRYKDQKASTGWGCTRAGRISMRPPCRSCWSMGRNLHSSHVCAHYGARTDQGHFLCF